MTSYQRTQSVPSAVTHNPFRELIQKPMDPAAPTVFAPVLLACDSCHELYEANDRPGLENDP